ncbi:hypothetical protein [Streptomyces sp. SP18CS02]|uniref:hypothetical protein n=1 Tax=Streptomyces sp. SP18CS02 TaxID=3002531 RepID=UPI002E77DE71|nr:hypothetical protein [Streptomyces sp. SP18CS02]MEE1753592.1 hypothetical protein [Streptomyces sp. SP18CS02]
MAFTRFGAGQLVSTGAPSLHRAPVAHAESQMAAAAFATTFGAALVILGEWCFGRI